MQTTYLKIILISTFIAASVCAIGQDEILFLNGKSLKGSLLDKTEYEFTFKDQKGRQFILDKYRVFSYTQNNKESIIYSYDTLSGNFLKVQDMKMFVYGERDAHETFKPGFSNLMAFGVGAGAGFAMQKDQSFLYLPAPLLYTTITLLFPTRVKQRRLTETKYIKEDEYLRGYERIARSKRTQGALRNSIIGMVAGYVTGIIVNGNSED